MTNGYYQNHPMKSGILAILCAGDMSWTLTPDKKFLYIDTVIQTDLIHKSGYAFDGRFNHLKNSCCP